MAAAQPQVRVGVAAFVLQSRAESPFNPRFLVGKRKGSHGAGTYALPGGHLEFGEDPEDCATRELLEETGLKVADVRFMTATNDPMLAENKHYITLFVACVRENEADEAEVLEPEKCEGWEWVTWEELVSWADGGEKKLFSPMLNLMKQRPGVVPVHKEG